MNRLPEAKASYERALTFEPGEILGYQRLAQLVWRNMHDPIAARGVLERMVKALPQDADSHLIRAASRSFRPMSPARIAAISNWPRSSASCPGTRSRTCRSRRCFWPIFISAKRNIPAAHGLLRDAVALYPRDLRLVKSLSWLELSRGNTPAAIAVLEDGLKISPEAFEPLVPLADLLVQQGDMVRTAEILHQLESRKTQAVQAKYLTARIAMRDAKWPEAIEKLEALRREVTNMPGLEIQLNLLLAVCADKTADYGAEEKAFQRVLNADPKNVQAPRRLEQPLPDPGPLRRCAPRDGGGGAIALLGRSSGRAVHSLQAPQTPAHRRLGRRLAQAGSSRLVARRRDSGPHRLNPLSFRPTSALRSAR